MSKRHSRALGLCILMVLLRIQSILSEVIGKPTNQFFFFLFFTCAQILSGSMPETLLEPCRIYFLLPYSLFHSNVSPVDLAASQPPLHVSALFQWNKTISIGRKLNPRFLMVEQMRGSTCQLLHDHHQRHPTLFSNKLILNITI